LENPNGQEEILICVVFGFQCPLAAVALLYSFQRNECGVSFRYLSG